MSMFETGTARHSMHNPDPVLHLLVRDGNGRWCTWCGGGLAAVENTPSQRRCPRCLALARQDIVDTEVEPGEPSSFDWYLQREVTPRPSSTPAVVSWWACPNEPPCPHGGVVHDIEDWEDTSPTCCVEGCVCPSLSADPPAAGVRAPADHGPTEYEMTEMDYAE